jgi:hypothetical protein
MKEEVELDEALKPKDKKVIDAFYDRKKLEGKLLFTDGDKLEKLGMGRDTVAVWKGHKDGEGPRWGHRIVITSQSAVKSDDVILRYMKKSIPKLNFDPKSYKKYFGEESVRGNDMEDKFKLQKETVEFLKPTSKNLGESIPDFKSTDFKGSKSVTITRISGGPWGIMIQLTDKKRVPSNIQLPASEAVVLGRALQNKDLMKEEVELDEGADRLTLTDQKVIDAFYDKKKLEGKLLFTDGDKLEKWVGRDPTQDMGRATVAVWKGRKIELITPRGGLSGHRFPAMSFLRYMKKSIPKPNFDPKSYKKYFAEEIEKTYIGADLMKTKEHQFLNPLAPSSMYPHKTKN